MDMILDGSLLQFLTGSDITISDTVTVTFTNVDGTTGCPIVQTCGSSLELMTMSLPVL